MAHKNRIVYVREPFFRKWCHLDYLDVRNFLEFVRQNFSSFSPDVQQTFLNLYDDLSKSYNPRNLKLEKDGCA